MAEQDQVHTVADWITVWVAQGAGSIMIKTREPHGDPVELSYGETVELIELLQRLAPEID
jgi:hypothetical protein